MGLERSSVSGLVDRAFGAVWYIARSAPMTRRRPVGLTEEGRRLAGMVSGQVEAMLVPMTGRLAAGEKARVAALLRKMLD